MTERAARVTAPVVLALFAAIGAAQSERPVGVAVLVALGVLAVGIGLASRSVSGWPLVAGILVAALGMAVLCHDVPSNLGWFGLCFLAGWVALRATLPPAVATSAALVAVFALEWLVMSEESGWGAWMAGTIFTTVACLFARRQRELVDQLREAQAGLAERARAEERHRVAAEMHDVIGHALTVSLLHVSSARLALDEEPDEARASLAEAERLARESLAEVRAAVGLLRTSSGADAPMPGGADISELVESFRRAGTEVRLDVHGDLTTLGATRGLAVYRIVQESLTNAARHAAGAEVLVRVRIGESGTTVEILSDAPAPVPATTGTGVLGMRERAEALGGRLSAGPGPDGWRVEAVLPT